MNNTKVVFWEKLQKVAGGIDQVAQYLVSTGLVTQEQIKVIFAKPESAWSAEIYLLLKALSSKISFMDYEWMMLPQEQLKFTIVTENSAKTISWPA